MKSRYKEYIKLPTTIRMRPYEKGENMSIISVSDPDDPFEDMGMIAQNPDNHSDRWYVAREYFNKHYIRK